MNDPTKDGIDHINIYSKGKTDLGRWLSNFTKEPFICDDGEFASIEAYWYWLNCKHPNRDKLRHLYGFLAKKVGRELGCKDWCDTKEFKTKIKTAMEIKLFANQEFANEFKYSILPFQHYYIYANKVVEVPENEWVLEHWEKLRSGS